jgi:microcystin-dependent protein
MSEPFLGQVSIFGFGFAPKGWALCNGQLLSINQNQALFALLGTTYGGNGIQTFALPNLQGSLPLHFGNGTTQGQVQGTPTVTLMTSEMGAHNHPAHCSSGATALVPNGMFWAADVDGNLPYSNTGTAAMAMGAIGNAGGSQAHPNLAPYTVLNFCIALAGIFPSRN